MIIDQCVYDVKTFIEYIEWNIHGRDKLYQVNWMK